MGRPCQEEDAMRHHDRRDNIRVIDPYDPDYKPLVTPEEAARIGREIFHDFDEGWDDEAKPLVCTNNPPYHANQNRGN
jgi:hypothetical protein